jgi:hypothetical protein
MHIDILALMQLQKLYDIVCLCFEALELHFFRGEHQLSAESPRCSLARSMD